MNYKTCPGANNNCFVVTGDDGYMYIYRIYDTPKRLVDPEEIADQNVVVADNDKISEKEGLDSVKELADVSFSNMELGQDEIFEEEDEDID